MSAIYLVFDPEGLSESEQREFREHAPGRTTAYPGKKQDLHVSRHFCALASHHGFLPSGGVAGDGEAAVAVAGSCWTDPDSERLSTPAELLALWRSRPRESLAEMAGLFAFGYYDRREMELVVESDRFGGMPLFYREGPRGIGVASEIKFLLRPGTDRPDPEAVAEFLALGYLSRPFTLIEGIRRLPAGSRLVCNRRGLRIEPFPANRYPRNRRLDKDTLAEYDGMVARYFRRFQGTADRFGASLSGGLDSRLVAYAAERAGIPFEAFTTGERSNLDTEIARRVADALGIPIRFHRTDAREMPALFGKMVWFTEGRVHPGHMHYISANFHRNVPPGPMLHGLGLEAVLGGHYDKPDMMGADARTIRRACLAATISSNFWPGYAPDAVFPPPGAARFRNVPAAVAEDLFACIGFSGSYGDFIEFRQQHRGVRWARPCILGQVLPWSDVVDPFFDHHAYELGTSLVYGDIAERTGQIRWGKEYFPGFDEIPRVKSGALLPIALDTPDAYAKAMRRMSREAQVKFSIGRLTMGRINLPMKNSFPQYWQWYPRHRPIRQYVDGILLGDQTLDRGFLQREGVRRLLRDCRIGRKVWNAVGTLLMMELLLRQFVDGTDIPEDRRVPWGV